MENPNVKCPNTIHPSELIRIKNFTSSSETRNKCEGRWTEKPCEKSKTNERINAFKQIF